MNGPLFFITGALVLLLFAAWRRSKKGLGMDRIAELKAQGALLLDVRTPGEFAGGHAPGSVNIPLDQLASRLGSLAKERAILVACASGMRSASAQALLERAGFTQVHNAGPWGRLV